MDHTIPPRLKKRPRLAGIEAFFWGKEGEEGKLTIDNNDLGRFKKGVKLLLGIDGYRPCHDGGLVGFLRRKV